MLLRHILGPMSGEIGSWLSGPESAGTGDGYPGQRLGLPAVGSGSLARMGRRLAALMVDWLIAVGLTGLLQVFGLTPAHFLLTSEGRTLVSGVWLLLGVIAVRLYGFTPGQYALGLRVASVDERLYVGTGRALTRGVLIALVIPALFTDSDGRGFQDRLTSTAVVAR